MRFRPTNFHFIENLVTLKNEIQNFTASIDASDVSLTADIIWRRKGFQKPPKSISNLLNLKINVLKWDVKVILLLFANFSENSYFQEKVVKMKALEINQNQQSTRFVLCYFASLSRFLTKTVKISQYAQCLHSIFAQFCDVIF